ncbi:uncharacterized protein LOC143540753 [Bidens hawaiensis]|uniref:uncharacterized protein LOC143540753 n=1 Tax=Bidens hawaiensis TaxID=980011 RepID=UPI00404A4513
MITYNTCYSTHHGLSSKQVNLMLPGLLERSWYRRRMLEAFTAVKSLTSSFIPVVTTGVIAHSLLILVVGMIYFIVATTRGSSFTWLSAGIIIVLVTYFHVNWWLALVVAVVESKSGILAFRRSSCLVKGMRAVSLLLFLYFVSFVWISLTSYLRHITVATAVLYSYCKAFHGELAIDEKAQIVEA